MYVIALYIVQQTSFLNTTVGFHCGRSVFEASSKIGRQL